MSIETLSLWLDYQKIIENLSVIVSSLVMGLEIMRMERLKNFQPFIIVFFFHSIQDNAPIESNINFLLALQDF